MYPTGCLHFSWGISVWFLLKMVCFLVFIVPFVDLHSFALIGNHLKSSMLVKFFILSIGCDQKIIVSLHDNLESTLDC